jgi:hypothetical protein
MPAAHAPSPTKPALLRGPPQAAANADTHTASLERRVQELEQQVAAKSEQVCTRMQQCRCAAGARAEVLVGDSVNVRATDGRWLCSSRH